MANGSGINGTAVAVSLAGAVLLYSGVKGAKVTSVIRSFVTAGPSATGPSSPYQGPVGANVPESATAPLTGGFSAPMSGSAAIAVSAAQGQLGKPYAWDTPVNFDTLNPPTFDCSGLTGWAYRRAGQSLTHFTGAQYAQLRKRPLSAAQPGDLVFFAHGGYGIPYHVGIYAGGGQIIEAPDYGIPVRLRNVSSATADIMPNVGAFPGTA